MSTDNLHVRARVVVTAADRLTSADGSNVLEELSNPSERRMIIPMTTRRRLQQLRPRQYRAQSTSGSDPSTSATRWPLELSENVRQYPRDRLANPGPTPTTPKFGTADSGYLILRETLTVMSAHVIPDASIILSLAGRTLDANGIVGDAGLSSPLRSAIEALACEVRDAHALNCHTTVSMSLNRESIESVRPAA